MEFWHHIYTNLFVENGVLEKFHVQRYNDYTWVNMLLTF